MPINTKFTFLCLSLILSIHIVEAQRSRIEGQLFDKNTNEKIPYAVIACRNTTDSTIYSSCVSDTIGEFILEKIPKNNYYLSIIHLAYHPHSIHYDGLSQEKHKRLQIPLDSKNLDLNEVTVNGKRTTSKEMLTKLEFVVTPKTLEGAQLATDVIANAPGITVDFDNNVSINGKRNILFLKNGVELSTQGMINQINPKSIQKVEIISNPSSRYSNQNYSAIINIKTKQIKQQLFSASTFVKASPKNNFYDALTNLSYFKNQHELFFTHKYYFRNYKQQLTTSYLNNEIDLDTTFTVIQKPRKESDNEFYYGYNFSKSNTAKIGILGYSSFYQENPNSVLRLSNHQQLKYSYEDENFQTNDIRAYFLNEKDSATVDIKLYHTWKDFTNNYDYFQTPAKVRQTTEKRIAGAEAIVTKTCLNFEYEYGTQFAYIKEQSNQQELRNSAKYRYSENRYSLFLNVSKNYNNRAFQLGGNLYYYNRKIKNETGEIDQLLFLPNFTYIEKLNKQHSLKLAVTTTLQNPTLWEMSPLANSIDPLQQQSGSSNLRAEINHNLSIAYTYSKKHTYFTTKIYHTVHRNNIVPFYEQQNEIYQNQYKNLHRFSSTGILSNLNFSIFSWWKIRSFGDLYQNHISSNSPNSSEEKWSLSANLTSIWPITPKILAGFIYNYTTSELSFNREYDNPDLNMFILKYSPSKKLQFSLMVLQPFGEYSSKTKYNNIYFTHKTKNKIDIQTILFSVKFNLLSKKKKSFDYELYENKDAKHP